MGTPKALVRGTDGVPWLLSSRAALLDAGCDDVLVVLGAEAEAATALLGDGDGGGNRRVPAHVVAPDWAEGMSASLRAGLAAAGSSDADAVLIHLVDLPDVGPDVVRRVLAHAAPEPGTALVRASYRGTPGHPVLIGRQHWPDLLDELDGDEGAKRFLARHDPMVVECADLATGHDVDTPEGLEAAP